MLFGLGLVFARSDQAFANCGEVRNQGGVQFCDYNSNGSPDTGESPFANCGGNLCCSTSSQCSGYTGLDCDPGSGFIPLGDCLKLSDDSKVSDVYTTPSFLVNLVVRNLFVFAGVIFFFMILLAGFQFVSGGKKGAENAKQIMTAAAIGFILMFAAYWIVQIVKIVTRTNIIL